MVSTESAVAARESIRIAGLSGSPASKPGAPLHRDGSSGIVWMSKDASGSESGKPLFRHSAMRSVGDRLFGNVAIAVPPSGRLALVIALFSLTALTVAICIVEVPQRSRAIGVLMPTGGFVDIVARRPGLVVDVFVVEGQLVQNDQLAITIGDVAYQHGKFASEVNLRSLADELDLLSRVHASQQEIAADRLIALNEQMANAAKQQGIAEERCRSLDHELAILEKRFQRWQKLVRGGHVSRDAFELEQVTLVRLRAERAEYRRTTVELSQRAQTISRSITEARKQLDLNAIEHAMGAERLEREIELERYRVLQEFRVSNQSVVAQVFVRPGDVVQSGQVLAKLRQPGDHLQAWLYLPTSTARLLRSGQPVEISLDAYPRQVYGTHTAVVTSVSAIALLPQEIRAPLLLAGPVFEVKAELEQADVRAEGSSWPLTPGTSFSAEIVQSRLRLYEWLFRSLRGDAGDSHR